jgi:hypothetical protein
MQENVSFLIIFNEEAECEFQLLLSIHCITRDIPICPNFCNNQFLENLHVHTTNNFLSQNLTGVCLKAEAKRFSPLPCPGGSETHPGFHSISTLTALSPSLSSHVAKGLGIKFYHSSPTHLPEMMFKHRDNFTPYHNKLFCNSTSKGKNTRTKIICFTLIWCSSFRCAGDDPVTLLQAASFLSMFQ